MIRTGGSDQCVWVGNWLWFGSTQCSLSGGECDSDKKCTCQADDKPCARKLMGAQKMSLVDIGYDETIQKSRPGLCTGVNEVSECVSEEEFCRARKTVKKKAPVSLGFLQAKVIALSLLDTLVANKTGGLEKQAQEMVCEYLSPVSVIDDKLGELKTPVGLVMARVFGMLVCYTEMIASEEDRCREFVRSCASTRTSPWSIRALTRRGRPPLQRSSRPRNWRRPWRQPARAWTATTTWRRERGDAKFI